MCLLVWDSFPCLGVVFLGFGNLLFGFGSCLLGLCATVVVFWGLVV